MDRVVYVDTVECTGCEYCADTLPEVFQMNDVGSSNVFDPNGAEEDLIQEIIDNCPAECIHWK